MEDLDLNEISRHLATERDRYRAIFQSMAEPAFVVDHAFRIIAVNKAFERFFAVSEDDVRGKNCRDIISYDLCGSGPLAEAIRGKNSFAEIEASIVVGGEKKVVLINGSSIEENGEFPAA